MTRISLEAFPCFKRFQSILLWTSLITVLMLSLIPVVVKAQRQPPDQGRVRLNPSSVSWTTLTAPGTTGNRSFSLDVEICNVTDGIGAACSVYWNASLFNLTDVIDPGATGMWWNGDSMWGPLYVLDQDAGELKDCAIGQLSPYPVPKTYPDGTWGLHVTLEFLYIGPDPAIGQPIESDIVFVDEPPLKPTYWALDAEAGPPDVVFKTFVQMLPSHFKFEAAPTLSIFDAVDGDHNVTWVKGSEPATHPYFDVEVKITDVTDLYAVVFSVHWDPTILNLTSCTVDGTCIFGTPVAPQPPGTGGTVLLIAAIDYAAGNLSEVAYSELAPLVPLNITSPGWGKVAKLKFEFVGPDPVIGLPVDTDIVLVDEDWFHAGGYKMPTNWWAYEAGAPVKKTFSVLGSCHFHYEAAPVVVSIKGKNVTIEGNVTITNALATKNALHFDASGPSGSTGWINVTFPMVNTTEIKVFINKVKLTPPPFPIITTNGTHYFIYFEFTLSTHNITIQFEPTPVGGIWLPINKLELLAPYIGLTILLAVAVTTVVYVKKKKRKTEIIS